MFDNNNSTKYNRKIYKHEEAQKRIEAKPAKK